jgi:hypothetical protein
LRRTACEKGLIPQRLISVEHSSAVLPGVDVDDGSVRRKVW